MVSLNGQLQRSVGTACQHPTGNPKLSFWLLHGGSGCHLQVLRNPLQTKIEASVHFASSASSRLYFQVFIEGKNSDFVTDIL